MRLVRTEGTTIRLSLPERRAVENAARDRDVPMAVFVREAALNAADTNNARCEKQKTEQAA